VEDEFLKVGGVELWEMVFEVGPCGLGACADGVGIVFVVVAAGTGFKEVRAVFVDTCYQKTDSVGSFGGFLGLDLRFCMDKGVLSAILKMRRLMGWLAPYVSL
jgi:hypothetical protein